MKQTKKPTRANKELMVKNNLNPENWRVVSETPKELVIMSVTGSSRTLSKGGYR